MLDSGGDDDRVHDVRGSGHAAGDACSTTGPLVVGADVAALEDARDLMLEAAAPGLGEYHHRHDRADAGSRQLLVQSKEVRVSTFGGQERTRVVDDGGH